ncbi:MAG: hypothetical protein K8F62_09135, partial [Pseudorhodoplanes sp.]|nr:hypothetical protein [Pseudorhodoplanes sp.]
MTSMTSRISILKRPFSVEPITGLMLPDGIFDSAIYVHLISVYIVNPSEQNIEWMFIRTKSTADYVLTGQTQFELRSGLKAGAATLIQWSADFRNATPGKKLLRIEVGGRSIDSSGRYHYWDGFVDANYFVSKTTYDEATKSYSCHVPQGVLTSVFQNSTQSPPTSYYDGDRTVKIPPIPVPQRFESVVRPTAGLELRLPFDDPWWKVVAWIIAAVAALAAIIAAQRGQGVASIGTTGHGHDDPLDYEWCVPDPAALPIDDPLAPAVIFSYIANAAILVGLADDIDPWERGRRAAPLGTGEVPLNETVQVNLALPDEMRAGTAFKVGATWRYIAKLSSGREVDLDVSETQSNPHIAAWQFDAPKEVREWSPIIVQVQGTRPDGSVYKGDELYGYAIFISPKREKSFRVPLLDDGIRFDKAANDGWYSAGIMLEELVGRHGPFEHLGEWHVQFVIQNVNDANPQMPPLEAATHIGGMPLMAPWVVGKSVNGSACTIAE